MNPRGIENVLNYLRREGEGSTAPAVSDSELLARYVAHRDEASFELLVRRHGPLVFGVARRMLRNSHTAEDVFQAVFLALARQAKSLRHQPALPSWLYRVTVRIAGRARDKQLPAPFDSRESTDPADEAERRELRGAMDAAIDRLPEKLRQTVIHCYLTGHTTEVAARLLDCPKGTVLSRLSAARERLQRDLIRHGVTASAATIATALTVDCAPAALPNTVVALGIGVAGSGAVIAPAIVALSKGAIAMSWTKVALATVVTMAAGVGATIGVAGPGPQVKSDTPKKAVAEKPAPPKKGQPEFNVDDPNTYPEFIGRKYFAAAGPEYQVLLVERAEAAGSELAQRYQEFRVGRGTLDIMLASARRRLDSQLEIVTDQTEKLTLYKGYHDLLKQMEELNDARFKAGAIKQQDLMQTTYARINARLMYLKAAGQGPPAAGAAK